MQRAQFFLLILRRMSITGWGGAEGGVGPGRQEDRAVQTTSEGKVAGVPSFVSDMGHPEAATTVGSRRSPAPLRLFMLGIGDSRQRSPAQRERRAGCPCRACGLQPTPNALLRL